MKPLQRFSAYLGQSILRRLSIQLGIFNPFTSFQPARSPPAEFTRKKKSTALFLFFSREHSLVFHTTAPIIFGKSFWMQPFINLSQKKRLSFFSPRRRRAVRNFTPPQHYLSGSNQTKRHVWTFELTEDGGVYFTCTSAGDKSAEEVKREAVRKKKRR